MGLAYPIERTVDMNAPHHSGSSEFTSAHLFPRHIDNGIRPHPHHPGGHSFLGLLPSSSDQAIQDFNAWNRSPQGLFPLQLLQGPGQSGNPPPIPNASHKCRRATSPEDNGPCSPDQEPNRLTLDLEPSPTVRFVGWKNLAHDIWPFVWGVTVD